MTSGPFKSGKHPLPGTVTDVADSHCVADGDPVSRLSEEQALNWFVVLNRAAVTDTERMAFNRWLALDPVNRRCYEAVLLLWQRLDLQGTPAAPSPQH
ncbi:MAG: FecR/PupR family sigma factor regulator [Pseudomonadales bacterium]